MINHTSRTLVLVFNDFNKNLCHAYWMYRATKKRTGQALLCASEAFKYLGDHPDTHCTIIYA